MGTKIRFSMLSTILGITSLIFITNCTKDDKDDKDVEFPVVATNEVSEISQTSATSGGMIFDDGGASVTARGVCWSIDQTPTISDNKTTDGTGVGGFVSSITGLAANTTYYVRAYATNSKGTEYGSRAVTFTTLENSIGDNIVFNSNITYGTMTDIEGNTYKTVIIGTQTWMAENLLTTKYNDGSPITYVWGNSDWSKLKTPGYCWFNNNGTLFSSTYGALYNWNAVHTGKLAPEGWHVPSNAEWEQLCDYLGGVSVAGDKLKEAGASHWGSVDFGGTNESGFTALPGANRFYDGKFYPMVGAIGFWWTTTEFSPNSADAQARLMHHYDGTAYYITQSKKEGYSVRCVKD
jgi:uncharacterized protein (TIGR02145 family)